MLGKLGVAPFCTGITVFLIGCSRGTVELYSDVLGWATVLRFGVGKG